MDDSFISDNCSDGSQSPKRLRVNMNEHHIQKLLECPVCYELVLPPIILCNSGHAVCTSCRQNLAKCPTCRCRFTSVRNLFAEHFLDRCSVKCRYRDIGCEVSLPGRELVEHQRICDYRPVICRECDQEIPYDQFLDHLRNVENLETQRAEECSTGFEIEDEELSRSELEDGEKLSVWEPTWINCHNQDFFCFLETTRSYWWLWIGALAPPEVCKKFVCSIRIWNKEKQTELKYVGKVHPIRTPPEAVLKSGECLTFLDAGIRNFMYKGGIDVLVRIDTEYQAPKTRRGTIVESPLSLSGRDSVGAGRAEPARANRVQINRVPGRNSFILPDPPDNSLPLLPGPAVGEYVLQIP